MVIFKNDTQPKERMGALCRKPEKELLKVLIEVTIQTRKIISTYKHVFPIQYDNTYAECSSPWKQRTSYAKYTFATLEMWRQTAFTIVATGLIYTTQLLKAWVNAELLHKYFFPYYSVGLKATIEPQAALKVTWTENYETKSRAEKHVKDLEAGRALLSKEIRAVHIRHGCNLASWCHCCFPLDFPCCCAFRLKQNLACIQFKRSGLCSGCSL